jgi:DNA-directed RNA polymerase subunit alpha
MNIPLPKDIKTVEAKDNWAHFQIEGLYPGYGITVGNALRRVLLSSLPGAAITQFKITGSSHEFSTIPGVTEDVIRIMMNLKKLRFKIFTNEPQQAVLKVKGEKEVKASDFSIPSQLELINRDEHIASLTTKNAELEMEIKVEKGLGYQTREKRENGEKLAIGVIPVDAIFTPVQKVSFDVSNMRVGDRTDFDKIDIKIETDGSINPEEALSRAAKILIEHFSAISGSPEIEVKEVKEPKEKKAVEKKGKKETKVKKETKTKKEAKTKKVTKAKKETKTKKK